MHKRKANERMNERASGWAGLGQMFYLSSGDGEGGVKNAEMARGRGTDILAIVGYYRPQKKKEERQSASRP